ncbi:MAG TPA: GDSL-type esterase/lipase family protein [Candidatus Hydrogenedentes bacterium]|nr:GDSL-type esterase/lipase family protein [Candidatus Hydrogenedentota bacterium]HPG69197.1 GDSL-type esterase/lipase family protein [Candidatus Hydrogenedentota bacterium]
MASHAFTWACVLVAATLCLVTKAEARDSLVPVQTLSPAALERSLVSMGDTARLAHALSKARRGETITVGVIGGSITAGAHASTPENRWGNRLAAWWRHAFPDTEVRFVNAGIGATGSDIGAHRVRAHLLQYEPDFVGVEFAVNDAGSPIAGETLEGLVRQILETPNHPAVVLLFTMHRNGTNCQDAHEPVGHHYNLPMVSFRDALWPEIEAGNMRWEDVEADEVHPNDLGHRYCAEFIEHVLDTALHALPSDDALPEIPPVPAPLLSELFVRTALLNADTLQPKISEGWEVFDGGGFGPFYGPGWRTTSPGSVLEFEVQGDAVSLVFYRIKGAMGIAEAQVDDKPPTKMDAWFNADWGGYTPFQLVARDLGPGPHTLRVTVLSEKNESSEGHEFRVQGVLCAGLEEAAGERDLLQCKGSGMMMNFGPVQVEVPADLAAGVALHALDWDGFAMAGLRPVLVLDGAEVPIREARLDGAALAYAFGDSAALHLALEPSGFAGLRITPTLRNVSDRPFVLNRAVLLGTSAEGPGATLEKTPGAVRVLEQGNYWGHVRPLFEAPPAADAQGAGEPTGSAQNPNRASDLVCVLYDRMARMALLTGFESSERWFGRFELTPRVSEGIVDWQAGFDGGDLVVEPGEALALETLLVAAGSDPWALLEQYGDAVRARHAPEILDVPPVSWCSWYPYRLGVTEDRILDTARVAAERLKPLGLSIIEMDLGWEKDQLPSTFEENDQFPHGLKWLSEQLDALGLKLGAWKAPFTISEFDPLAKEHPEWLIQGDDGQRVAYWTWFWAPHGNVYILDLTHPGARDWLRQKMQSLHDRGIRYLKSDFIGCVSGGQAKNRYDRHIVMGGGVEAARLGAQVIREALPDALLLNCGGPEMPGSGHWPVLYTCSDTGNTGFITAAFERENYQSVACHLFKNRRWGILQPSCLCVGLPGTIEEARLRATIAFLAGGQIDISDTLTTLPEDRWVILTATLPPLGISAKPMDLFEPVYGQPGYEYSAVCSQEAAESAADREMPPGSVWHLHVAADWDEWDLVGVFSFDAVAAEATPTISRFVIPLARLGLDEAQTYWAYEFWSQQFAGTAPGMRKNPRDYAHPGDFQDLLVGDSPGTLDMAFFGPAAKLMCLRKPRPHPWVVGTTFHQSCGAELHDVAWDAAARTLSGIMDRPAGEQGDIIIVGAGMRPSRFEIDGRPATGRHGANGAWILPVTVVATPTAWQVVFEPDGEETI